MSEQIRRGSSYVPFDAVLDANPWEAAVREWVAQQLRTKRGHAAYTRHQIRNVRFGIENGWAGTDVTEGDPDYAVVTFEKQAAAAGGWSRTDWRKDSIPIDNQSPAEMVAACLAIAKDLFIP